MELPLCKPVVNYNQQGIKAVGQGKVSDEVTRDLLEGVRGMEGDQRQGRDSRMGVGFSLLAGTTVFNIPVDEVSESGPPEFSSD